MIQLTSLAALLPLALPLAAAQEEARPRLLSVQEAQRSFVHAPDLRVTPWIGTDLDAPVELVWDAADRAWVLCEDGSLRVREADGLRTVARFEDASGLAVERDGLVVARRGGLEFVRLEDGAPERKDLVPLAPGVRLSHLTRGLDGWLYAIRRGGGGPEGVVRWNAASTGDDVVPELVVALQEPRSLALSFDGELFAATRDAHYLHVVVPDAALSAGRVGDVSSFVDGADHAIVQRLETRGDASALFGEPGGALVFEGSGWPSSFENNYLVCEPRGGLVHRDLLARWGVSFRAKRSLQSELLASTDPWFRPVAVRQGPEGRLYVLDRYGAGAEGRIWQLDHVARAATSRQSSDTLAALDVDELLRELDSGSRWVRETAHHLLRERGLDDEQEAALILRTKRSPDPLLRLHALWLVSDRRALLADSVASFDPRVRVNALRLFAEDPRSGAGLGVRAFEVRIQDGDGRVRIAAWRAWKEIADVTSFNAVALRYPGLEDDWARSLALAMAAQRPATFLSAALRRPESAELNELVRLLSEDVVRRRDARDAVTLVLELGGGDRSPRIVSSVLRTLTRLQRDAPWPSTRLSTTLRRLAVHEDLRIASAAMPLARLWLGQELGTSEVDGWGARVLAVVADEDSELEARVAGLGDLVDVPETRPEALELADGLLERPVFAGAVLDALESGSVTVSELGEDRAARLRGHADEAVRTRASALLAP